jgi:hypothetical protein
MQELPGLRSKEGVISPYFHLSAFDLGLVNLRIRDALGMLLEAVEPIFHRDGRDR